MTGGRVGNWVLGEELGRGPIGVVYRGENADTGRPAAVKVVAPDPGRPPDFPQTFPAEMLFLQRLNHPNVTRFYDAGAAGGSAFYATELVDGPDLATALKRRPRKPDEPGLGWADDLLRIAVQLARALKHGHHRSVLHRGLKPANVLLAADGTVKLADFGVAKVLAPPPGGPAADPWGTAGFLAPEHFTGKPYTKKSDLYALGGVLYAVVAGRPPFAGSTPAEFMHKHCYTLPDRPAQFVPEVADRTRRPDLRLAGQRPGPPSGVGGGRGRRTRPDSRETRTQGRGRRLAGRPRRPVRAVTRASGRTTSGTRTTFGRRGR